jgi:hypothetical protein
MKNEEETRKLFSIKACGSTSYHVALVVTKWGHATARVLVVVDDYIVRECLRQNSLLGLTISRISTYMIPCAYGRINSVPSILIISTVWLDIQIERSQSYQCSSQTTVKQTLSA